MWFRTPITLKSNGKKMKKLKVYLCVFAILPIESKIYFILTLKAFFGMIRM